MMVWINPGSMEEIRTHCRTCIHVRAGNPVSFTAAIWSIEGARACIREIATQCAFSSSCVRESVLEEARGSGCLAGERRSKGNSAMKGSMS